MALKWIQDDRIVVFSLGDTTRQSVDQFVDEVKTTRTSWDTTKPLLAIYDVSHGNILLNSYVRTRSLELAENPPPDLYGAYAVVVSDTIIGTLVTVFLNLFSDKHPSFKGRAFHNFEQSVQWLNEQSQTVLTD